MALQFRRGTDADRIADSFTPAVGEPIYTTDTKLLYIGDGQTVGGVRAGTNIDLADVGDVVLTSSSPVGVSSVAIINTTANDVTTSSVVITTSSPHGLINEDDVRVFLDDFTQVNGIHEVLVESSTVFRYVSPTTLAPLSNTTVTGSVFRLIPDDSILSYDATNEQWIDQTFIYRLVDLGDVNISDPQNNQIIRYNTTSQKYENTDLSISIGELSDVTLTGTPTEGQLLIYSASGGAWTNQTYETTLGNLSNVTITSPSTSQVLSYDGSKWINQTVSLNNIDLGELGDVSLSSLADEQIIQYNSDTSTWENVTFTTTINNFTDVNITNPQDDEILSYSGGKIINKSLDLEDLSDVSGTSSPSDRQVLAYSSSGSTWTAQTISSLSSRVNATLNTGQIAAGATVDVDFTAFTGYAILRAQASAPCVLTLYAATEDRTADASRALGTAPPLNSGIFAELTFLDTGVHRLGPVLIGYNDDETISRAAYAKVRNTDSATVSDISITLTIIQLEEDPT